MKFVEFKRSLNELIAPIYVFYGNDEYLFETCIKNLKSACEIKLPDLNLASFGNSANFDDVLTSLETLPFADKLRLVILDSYVFNDTDKKKFYAYAQNVNKSVCFAVICGEECPFVQKENITFVDCGKLDATMIKRKVTADLSEKGVLISDDALKVLISFCDFSLTKIYSELEKLTALAGDTKAITEDMVRTLCVKDLSYSIFELTNSLGNKDLEKTVKIFNNLIESADINVVMGLLYGHFRRLLIVSITPSNIDNEKLANNLQVKPYAIKIAKAQAKNFGTKKLYALCEKLQEIDLRIKNTFSNPENELYSFIFSCLGD